MKFRKLVEQAIKVCHRYTVTVTEDRYGGGYSGGTWLALPGDPTDCPPEPWAQDTLCMKFWQSKKSRKIGRGKTPKKALEDLIARYKRK